MPRKTYEDIQRDAILRKLDQLHTAQLRASIKADVAAKLAPLRAYAFARDVARQARRR